MQIQIGSTENSVLEEKKDEYSYFLMKQCVGNFFNANTIQQAFNIIDKEAIDKLGIDQNNIKSLYDNFNNPDFNIDKIYKQEIDESKDIYMVYLRLKKNSQSNEDVSSVAYFVKIDKKNVDFSIYPYEYLQKFNFLQYKENDKISINITEEIEKNDDNGYKVSLISKDEQSIIKELFERFKFDIKFDNNGLYNKIDNEYKSKKFEGLDDFKNFINSKKQQILNENISKYQVNEYENYNDYIAISEDEEYYIFSTKNLMDYTILLDRYTVLTEKVINEYNGSLVTVKARYCINRIIRAINNKDYEFVYKNMNTIQKNNYYRDIEDLKEYIQENFYEKNNVEIDDEYKRISSNVYEYTVNLTDASEEDLSYRRFRMTVTIKDGMDFEISIVN